MVVLVCYDVSTKDEKGPQRLRRVAELCKDHGVRVQYSVFECRIDAAAWVSFRHRLLAEARLEYDSLRFYFINARDAERTEHHGARVPLDPTGPLIV